MPDTHFRYFTLRRQDLAPGHKTRVYSLVNRDAETIGTIGWYAPWRQFCFFPGPGTVWSDGCVADIKACLAHVSRERLKEREAAGG